MIDNVHCEPGLTVILWLCAGIALAVCGVMLYSIARFRAVHDTALANFARRSVAEVLWASIPILILVGAAGPTVRKVLVAASAACLATPPGL